MAFLKPRSKYPMSCFRSCGVFQVLQLKNICFKRYTLPLMSQILCSIRDCVRLVDSAHAWKCCLHIGQCKTNTEDCGLRTADYRLRTRGKMQTADWEWKAGWTSQNVFPSFSPTTQPFVPSRPLFENTFTSKFHPPSPLPLPVATNVFKAAPIVAYRRSSNLRKFFREMLVITWPYEVIERRGRYVIVKRLLRNVQQN